MAISTLLVKAYANNIIIHGTRTFTTIDASYVQPVKQYVAENPVQYTYTAIDSALVRGNITEAEYTEILALRATFEQSTAEPTA